MDLAQYNYEVSEWNFMETFMMEVEAMLDIIRRRNGMGSLGRLQTEMNDLFGRFLGDDWPLETARGGWWPAIDVSDHGESIVARAEMPGMKPEDIEISVTGNVLTISGEKKESTQEKDENRWHMERRYGAFRREFTLPGEVNVDQIKADYRDGVLSVTMPKSERAKPKRIEVKS